MAKKNEAKELPTLEQSNPNNPYKRFLALGTVLAGATADIALGDLIGCASLGKVTRENGPDYNNYNVKIQKGFTAQRLPMADALRLQPEDIRLDGTEPLIGVVVDCGNFIQTQFGPAQSITVCLNLEDISVAGNEQPF